MAVSFSWMCYIYILRSRSNVITILCDFSNTFFDSKEMFYFSLFVMFLEIAFHSFIHWCDANISVSFKALFFFSLWCVRQNNSSLYKQGLSLSLSVCVVLCVCVFVCLREGGRESEVSTMASSLITTFFWETEIPFQKLYRMKEACGIPKPNRTWLLKEKKEIKALHSRYCTYLSIDL